MMQNKKIERPKCCGECARFEYTPEDPHMGGCDEWAPAGIHPDTWCCEPCIGIKGTPRKMNNSGTKMDKSEVKYLSPLPWHYEINDNAQFIIYDADGHEVAQVYDNNEHDVDVIVKSVNRLGAPIAKLRNELNLLRRTFEYQDDGVALLARTLKDLDVFLSVNIDYAAIYASVLTSDLIKHHQSITKALDFFRSLHEEKEEIEN